MVVELETQNEALAHQSGKRWAERAAPIEIARVREFANRGMPQEYGTPAALRLALLLSPDCRDGFDISGMVRVLSRFWPANVSHDDAGAAAAWVSGVLEIHEQREV